MESDHGDPLEREPSYDFAAFREHCETYAVSVRWVEFEFVAWLYSH